MHDRPCADPGLTSYRYRGRYGWIMIGAVDVPQALREASRSTDDPIDASRLEVWERYRYVPIRQVTNQTEAIYECYLPTLQPDDPT